MDKIRKFTYSSLLVGTFFLVFSYGEGAFINLKIYEHEWLSKVLRDPLNNVNVRPTILNTTEPIEISVSLHVRNFELIDDKKMEYSIQVTLQQEWEDDRLAYAKFNPVQLRQIKYLTLLEPDKIWRPDLYFLNEKSGNSHSILRPNNYARIYANGTVIFVTRLTLTLACPMNLRYFPFDNPICSVRMASYAFARDDLIFKWKPVTVPITVSPEISLAPEFKYDTVTSNYCDTQAATGGVSSCLLGEFHFRRSRSYYLKQNYIPMANQVIIAWFSFLLDFQSDKTFLFRGLICLATMSISISQASRIGQIIPRTTYTTALDIWNGISLTFIFVAFSEFMVVYYLSTHKFGQGSSSSSSSNNSSIRKSNNGGQGSDDFELGKVKIDDPNEPENFEVERKKSVEVQTHWTTKLAPERIEKWTLILYPSLYAGFNFIYWLICSNHGDSN